MQQSSEVQHQTAMIYESPYDDGFSYPAIDIPDLILDYNLKGVVPEKPAIIDGLTGQTVYNYSNLRDRIRHFGGFLQHILSIKKGDVVSYLSLNTTYYPIIIHAILAAGGTVSAFNPAYTPDEIAHSLKLAKPKHILVQDGLIENLESAFALLGQGALVPSVHVLDGQHRKYPCHDVEQILVQSPKWSPLQRIKRTPQQTKDDVAFICFSSGTSGLVKGVRLTHGNVVANVHQQGRCLENMFTPETVFTLVVPFYHILGLAGFCIQYLAHGAPIVVFKKFELDRFLESVTRDRVTHINVVPPIALAILQSPLSKQADFSSVRCLMNAAAPLKDNLAKALCKLVGCVVTQWYGMTEASPSVISQREDEAYIPGTIGRLLPGMQLRIIDEEGRDVPIGTPGELLIRGPNLMARYQGQEEQAARAELVDGFFRTGDAGYIDDNGFIYLTDRVKELIKVKGNQVAPAELESILLSHARVTDAAVCGLYLDDEATEYPIAYITTIEPAHKHPQLVIDVADFVAGQVAQYKRLRAGVQVLDAIPKNPAGKILRRLLPARIDPETAAVAARAFRSATRAKL